MLFPTITFAIFLTLVLGVHSVLFERPTAWKATMLVASYVFYAWWDWRFLALIWVSTAVDFVSGALISAASSGSRRRILLGLSVATNLGMLAFFKYADFFVESFVNLMADIGISVSAQPLGIILPVGISFYTFQTMSYSIDIYRGKLEPTRSLLDFALFVGFFPQLVAGPIVRARDFLTQLATPSREPIDVGRAIRLILGGLFKKIVIADFLATEIVDRVFANPASSTGIEALVAIYAYALQIYCDFSGYSDIAIGIALLLGFRFAENFNQPYRSRSLQEFWRRWHISLSSWLRDYLYFSLGGSRGKRILTSRNLLITMILGGLWHGAGWTFVLWGAFHGVALVAERMIFGISRPAAAHSIATRFLQTFVTFHLVCFGWVLFRSVTLHRAGEVLGALGGSWTSAPTLSWKIAVILLLGVLTQVTPRYHLNALWRWLGEAPVLIQAGVITIAIVGMEIIGPEGVAPFIYFQF